MGSPAADLRCSPFLEIEDDLPSSRKAGLRAVGLKSPLPTPKVIVQTAMRYAPCAVFFRCFRIWPCSSLKSFGGMASDFLTNRTAAAGQGPAHTPQPIHHSRSTTGKSPSILITWTGQISTH